MPKVYQRAAARRDLVEHFVYLAENAGLDIAERFLANAATSFDELAGQPMIGAPLTLRYGILNLPACANGESKTSTTPWSSTCLFLTECRSCGCCMPRVTGGV